MANAKRARPISGANAAPLPELSRVVLRDDRTDRQGTRIPGGSSGTIVAVLAGGEAYTVEFLRPVEAILTVEAAGVQAIADVSACGTSA